MKQIINLEAVPYGDFIGFIENDKAFVRFKMSPTGKVIQGSAYRKTRPEYRDYETFWQVYGKFNPEIFFLKDPIPITALSIAECRKVASLIFFQ